MGRIKRIGLLLALLAAALGLGGCGYDASVEELFTLPRMAEGYTDLAQQLDGLLNQGYEYASPTGGRNIQSVQMVDLDGDGSMELLLGAVGAPEIYAMYTMKDGVETQVIDAGERNSYRLGTDGVFINQGSNSAAQSGTMLFTFENGELHFQDGLVSDFSVDEKNPWFYVKDQNWDSSTYEALDTESAEAIIAQLDANVRPISYIPFSEYQS